MVREYMNQQEKTIIVNAREHIWSEHKISFEQVITLAYGSYDNNPLITYTVSFKKGDEKKHEGKITKGDEVPVKDGMIFNVSLTDRS